MPRHVPGNFVVKLLYKKSQFRSWPHNTHIPLQNIQELRQFIEACIAQKTAKRGDAGIRAAGMLGIAGDGIVHEHRPEFEHLEALAVETHALLHKENRPSGSQLDQGGSENHDWRCKKKCKRRKNDVKNSLAKSIANGVNRIELDVKQWNSIIVEDSFRDEHAFSQIQDQPYGNAQMLNDFQNCVHVLLSRRSSRVVGKRKGEQAGKGTVRGVLEKRSIVPGKRGLARYVLGTALCSRERCRNNSEPSTCSAPTLPRFALFVWRRRYRMLFAVQWADGKKFVTARCAAQRLESQ